jgi:hypothetical protein
MRDRGYWLSIVSCGGHILTFHHVVLLSERRLFPRATEFSLLILFVVL